MTKLILFMLFAISEIAIGNNKLIGGRNAEEGQFPEVLYITSGNSSCTATIVGPKTILTAAHCVDNGGQIEPVEFQKGQTLFAGKCFHHPQYYLDTAYDFALCVTGKEMQGPYGSISSKPVNRGDWVTLSGYGCVREGGGGGNNGRLKYGEVAVTKPADNGWFYTQGDAALCFGDSGGPAFAMLQNPRMEPHYIVGVNSRGNIKDLSLLSATYLPENQKWFKEFGEDRRVDICGINMECINEDPEPEPEPEPPFFCEFYKWRMDHHLKRFNFYKGKYDSCINQVGIPLPFYTK